MTKIIVRYVAKKQSTATRVKALVRRQTFFNLDSNKYTLKQYLFVKIILSFRVRVPSKVFERPHRGQGLVARQLGSQL